MNKNAEMKYSVLQKVFQFIEDKKDILNMIPMFLSFTSKMKERFESLRPMIVSLQRNVSEETELKRQKGYKLAELCTNYANLLYTYGEFNDIQEFKEVPRMAESSYKRLTNNDLLSNAEHILLVMKNNTEEVLKTGITEVLIGTMETDIQEYAGIMHVPINLRTEKKDYNHYIENEINSCYSWLNVHLVKYMKSNYKATNPELFSAFGMTLVKPKVVTQTRMLSGLFTDAETHEPVRNVEVIADGKAVGKHGGKKGLYHLANIGPGQHSFEFRLKGYETEVREVNILSGKPLKLNIEFRPLKLN